jgi:hypothetical protein
MDSPCSALDFERFEHEADIGCNRVFVLLMGMGVACPGYHESRRRGANQK